VLQDDDTTEEVVEETIEEVEIPEDSESDIRASIREAMKQHLGAGEEEEAPRSDRARDDKGRFAPKVETSDQSPAVKVAEAPKGPISPPHSWTDEKKALFLSLPPAAQEYILQRETEVTQGLSRQGRELSEVKRRAEQYDSLLGAHQELFDRNRVSPVEGVQQLLMAQQALDDNPAEALKIIGQSYGLKVEIAQGDDSPYNQTGYLSPVLQKINTLEARLARQEEERQAHQARLKEERQAHAIGEVQSFAAEVDSNGTPLRPYIQEVADDMLFHIAHLKAEKPELSNRQVLHEAYERALWANPTTREKALSAERSRLEAQERAKRSKLAGSSVKSSPDSASLAPSVPDDIRGAIRLAISQNANR